MRIDLAHDRTDHHPDRYRDPAVARDGLFAVLEEHELSDAEKARRDQYDARQSALAEKEEQVAAKPWGPTAILSRLTKLYARFAKPGGKA